MVACTAIVYTIVIILYRCAIAGVVGVIAVCTDNHSVLEPVELMESAACFAGLFLVSKVVPSVPLSCPSVMFVLMSCLLDFVGASVST